MKVLIWMVDHHGVPGGHRVQAEQTCRALRRFDVDAQISFCESLDAGEFDLIHGVGLSASEIRQCRLAGAPLVLTPLYCGLRFISGVHIDTPWGTRLWHRVRMGAVLSRSALSGRHVWKCTTMVEPITQQRIAFEMADALLPNSIGETDAISTELEVTTPCHVVTNGADPSSFDSDSDAGLRQGVLYVGRFEPHKNQLGLIRAMKGSPLELTLAGPPHPHHPEYYQRCCREAGSNVRILPAVEQDQLCQIYQRAKVHVLPSWFETTGLVSLEAALCGCNIVTTSRGYAREYFGDMAWYCDPGRPRTIIEAVMAAHEAPVPRELRQHILHRYTWEHTARTTLDAYERVLNVRRLSMSGQVV